MSYKSQPMSQKQSLAIANDFLAALKLISSVIPLQLTTCIKGGTKIVRKVVVDSSCTPEKVQLVRESFLYAPDQYHDDNTYLLLQGSRVFEIALYDSPEIYGCCSILPNYDEETYIFCLIQERRGLHGKIKQEMAFGFDIEKNILVELFDIDHYNTNNLRRESGDSIEELLKGRTIF